MSDLEIPGRTRLPYFHEDNGRAAPHTTTLNGPNGPEIHTAGGYSKFEHLALELAKSAAHGCAASTEGQEIEPGDLGRWAARAASALLEECQAIQASGGRVAIEP